MSNKALLVTITGALAIFAILLFMLSSTDSRVTLVAKPWNDGDVHLWHTLVESEATYTDVREGTRCERLDNKTHRLIGPPPPIYYYRVNCDGIVGYVEIDQVR